MADAPDAPSPKSPRSAILRAAAAEFAARGFSGARVDAIARRAGVNKAMLYYPVGGKAALYDMVISEAVASMWSAVEEGVSKASTPEGRLAAIAEAFASVGRARPYMPRIILREMATGGKDLTEPMIKALGRIIALEQSIICSTSAKGCFRKVHPATLHILLVVGTMLHIVAKPMSGRIAKTAGTTLPPWPEAPGRAVADLVLRGLLIRPEASAEPRTRHGSSKTARSAHEPAARKIRKKEDRA